MLVINAHDISKSVASLCRGGLRTLTDWQTLTTERNPIIGRQTAKMTIMEFVDYQCPYCARVDPIIVDFATRHSSDVAVYRYNLPLQQIHPHAYQAAIAANCAEVQGVREPYQSALFLHQKEFATIDWTVLAKQNGVQDTEGFSRCVKEEKPRDHILKDIKTAESLGIEGTPSFIINGTLYTSGLNEEMLESHYKEMDRKEHGFMHRLFNM
jgi:protein-disulfide isomerase